tara:strand:- start:42 stop:527 length:486 start_codon:yes stop_codon:yes gene_type:complete
MAIPASGPLDFLNMARECAYGTWGSGSISGAISIRDLVAGGNSFGSGQSYPAINTSSPSFPPNTTPVETDSFYEYDKDASSLSAINVKYDGSRGASSSSACEQEGFETTIYSSGTLANFLSQTNLYANSTGTLNASTGWYSNGVSARRWNGSTWSTALVNC